MRLPCLRSGGCGPVDLLVPAGYRHRVRLEHRDDMLLSTPYDYLMATGAEGAGIVVIVRGHRIELGLSRLRNPPGQQSALAHCPCHVTLPQSEYA